MFFRIELDLLKDARESDISRMTGKKKKGKKGKKDKKGKGKKGGGKGKKNPFGNNPPEKVFQELLDSGIIRTYPEVELTQFHGDFNYKVLNLRFIVRRNFNCNVADGKLFGNGIVQSTWSIGS